MEEPRREERRRDANRDGLERMIEAVELRTLRATEEGIERAAVKIANMFSIHDLSTKEGQLEHLADQQFNHANRRRCEALKERAWLGVATIGVPAILIAWWEPLGEIMKRVFGR